MHASDTLEGRRARICRRTSVAARLGAAVFVAAGLGYGLGTATTAGVGFPSPEPAGDSLAAQLAARADEPPEAHAGPAAIASRYVSGWRRDLGRISPRLLDAYLSKPDPWSERLVPILAAHDVPPEFLYLALVESGMDPEARSPAAAVGLWQFTTPTARAYGLIVGDEVDQRLDWRLSTAAAGRYLRDLYGLFGTWDLAAAAYNAGPGRVTRALAETGADSYWDLVEAGRLPAETRDYVPKFLAIVELAAERAVLPTRASAELVEPSDVSREAAAGE